MSLNVEDKQCQMCNAYLFEDDDVAFCPVCGAPHHRECYKSLGHCALEHLHGTEQQYSNSKKSEPENSDNNEQKEAESTSEGTVKCKMCETEYDSELPRCPECNAPNFSKMGGGYAVFDLLGGVPAETDLGEGVTADEAKKFVFANSYRYVPKFFDMRLGKKASWNWIAFLLPGPWMLSRKMYGIGILFSVLNLVGSLFTAILQGVIIRNVETGKSEEIIRFFLEDFSFQKYGSALILALIGVFISLAVHLVSGIFGDYFYRNHTIAGVKEIKETEDAEDDIWRKKGGISIFAMILGLFAFIYLPEIIAAFLL